MENIPQVPSFKTIYDNIEYFEQFNKEFTEQFEMALRMRKEEQNQQDGLECLQDLLEREIKIEPELEKYREC